MKHVSELKIRGIRSCPTCSGNGRKEGVACPKCLGTGKVEHDMIIGELAAELSLWYLDTESEHERG